MLWTTVHTGREVLRTAFGLPVNTPPDPLEITVVGSPISTPLCRPKCALHGGAAPSGGDITGATENIVIGQQVQLQAQWMLPDGFDNPNPSWKIEGSTASGWTPGIKATGAA